MKYRLKNFNEGILVNCVCIYCVKYKRGPFKIIGPASGLNHKELLCFNFNTGLTRRFKKENLRIHYVT